MYNIILKELKMMKQDIILNQILKELNDTKKILKEKIYIKTPAEAPEGVKVQEGKRGGLYYESKINEDNINNIKTYNVKINSNEEKDLVEDLVGKNIYARATNFNSLFEFLNSKSEDHYIPNPKNPQEPIQTKEEIEKLIESANLDAEPILLNDKDNIWGLRYNGVNAIQYHDSMMFPKDYKNIIIFEGKYLGNNIFGDGDTVKPVKIVAIINRI